MEQDKNLTAEIQQEETLEGAIPPVTFDEFTPPSYEEWKQEVVTALKGGSFEKSMFTKTYEGITLNPIYRLEDQEKITHIKPIPAWKATCAVLMQEVISIKYGLLLRSVMEKLLPKPMKWLNTSC